MRKILRAITILRQEGVSSLVSAIRGYFYTKILSVKRVALTAVLLGLVKMLGQSKIKKRRYTIVLRSSNLDSDTVAILSELSDRESTYEVYLCCDSKETFRGMNERLRDEFKGEGISISVVEKTSYGFVQALLSSEYIFADSDKRSRAIRYFDHNDKRKYIVIDHGPVTKAYGAHKSTKKYDARCSLTDRLKSYLRRNIDIKTTSSELHKYYLLSGKQRLHTEYNTLATYGYPRFDRIEEIAEQKETPILKEKAEKELSEDYCNVLYAPTHHPYPRDPLQLNGEIDQLREFLESNDVRVYVRMHIGEEKSGFYQELIDGDTIRYAGHTMSPASTEVLSYFDILVTDFSSIYMEFLPLDRPIVFLDKNYERFEREYGLGFEYQEWFPGKKVSNVSDFTKHVEDIMESGDDGFAKNRAFVRRAYLNGEREEKRTSLERLTGEY